MSRPVSHSPYPADWHRLARHHRVLLDHVDAILDHRPWAAVTPCHAHLGMAFAGGVPVVLGGLVALWATDLWRLHDERADVDVFPIFVSGSPLTNMNCVIGFTPEGSIRRIQLEVAVGRPTIGKLFRVGHRAFPREERVTTGWSLPQLLAELGVPQEDVAIRDREGCPVALWSHAQRRLLREDGRTLIELSDRDLDAAPDVVPIREGPPLDQDVRREREALGERVAPFAREGSPWGGRSFTARTRQDDEVFLTERDVRYRTGFVPFRCDDVLPLPVLRFLVARLDGAQQLDLSA